MHTIFRWNERSVRIAAAAVALAAAGCGPLQSPREEDHPLMRRALSLQRVGDIRGAIEAYQHAIETKPGFARAHLNIAILYSEPPHEDFVRAIYHYERYLDLRPGMKLWALHSADGQPIMLTDSREAAIANATEADLTPMMVH